jgi:hypothetical protein
MKNFLRHFRLSENLIAHGNFKTPGSKFLYSFSIIFLLVFSVANAQRNFLSVNNTSNFTAEKKFRPYTKYFEQKDYASDHFATFTSSQNGSWNDINTWGGAGIPGAGDDVVIDADNIVTVDAGAQVRNITINGQLDINNNINLDVNGDFINNGTFNAGGGTASVSFKGGTNNTIGGISSTVFNNIVIDKGSDPSTILESNSSTALLNTGTLTILNGLFEITTGTFQFGGNSQVNIPSTAGIWVHGGALLGGNFTVVNDGWIRVSSGTANFGNSSGNALHIQNRGYFDISGGAVNISGRLENTASTPLLSGIPGNGVSIIGGMINLATVGNNASSTGSFDMSSSSILNMTGGTVVFQNPSTAITPVDLSIIAGGIKSITGGVFQVGPSPGTYRFDAGIPLYNVTVNTNSSLQLVTVNGNPYDLAITNQLTLNGPLSLGNQNLVMGANAPAIAGSLGSGNGMIISGGTGEARKIFSN